MKVVKSFTTDDFSRKYRYSPRVESAARVMVDNQITSPDKALHVTDIGAMVDGTSVNLTRLLRERPGFVEITSTGKKPSQRFFYLPQFYEYKTELGGDVPYYPSDLWTMVDTPGDYPYDAALIDPKGSTKEAVPVNHVQEIIEGGLSRLSTTRLTSFSEPEDRALILTQTLSSGATGKSVNDEFLALVTAINATTKVSKARTEVAADWEALAVFAASMTARLRKD